MLHLVGPLLVVLGLGLYFPLATRFAWYRRYPGPVLAAVAAGVAIAVWNAASAPGIASLLSAGVTLALAGFAGWYFFRYSQYGPRGERPGEGDRFPHFDLPASAGGRVRLEDLRGRAALLLFFRGGW